MLYNRCTVIYKFGSNTYPRRIRRMSNLGHIFRGKKVRLMGREIGTYWFSTATMVTRTHLNVTLYLLCLSR